MLKGRCHPRSAALREWLHHVERAIALAAIEPRSQAPKPEAESRCVIEEVWSGLRESNPSSWLGKPEHYHYAKPAVGGRPARENEIVPEPAPRASRLARFPCRRGVAANLHVSAWGQHHEGHEGH